ncbi:MAG: hypothetical protein AMXMBFR13_17280 [Phycisphaerae bacterium]|jgi:hypothetical protein
MNDNSVNDRIEQHLRSRICAVCVNAEPDGACGLPAQYPCPLFLHLDQVINVVASTQDDSVSPYVDRLRKIVCSHCRMDSDGDCEGPAQHICPLDSYFPLVIELIEGELASAR